MKKNSFFNRLALAAMALGLAFPSTVAAQDAVALEGDVRVERTVIEDGTQTTFWDAPATVVPGDRLKFTTSYTNTGAELVEDFVVTNPLPAAIALIEDSESFLVSVDGGETFGRLADLTAADDLGRVQPASLADVTHVRWVLESVAPGETGALKYYATVR